MQTAYLCGLIILVCNAVQDIRKREILFWFTIAAGLSGLIYSVWQGAQPSDFILALLPGFIMLTASLITKGKIGIGDGLVILALGLWTGCPAALYSLACGLLVSLPAAAAAQLTKKKDKELPFIPCLLPAYLFLPVIFSCY